jgi:hypothetical protein
MPQPPCPLIPNIRKMPLMKTDLRYEIMTKGLPSEVAKRMTFEEQIFS